LGRENHRPNLADRDPFAGRIALTASEPLPKRAVLIAAALGEGRIFANVEGRTFRRFATRAEVRIGHPDARRARTHIAAHEAVELAALRRVDGGQLIDGQQTARTALRRRELALPRGRARAEIGCAAGSADSPGSARGRAAADAANGHRAATAANSGAARSADGCAAAAPHRRAACTTYRGPTCTAAARARRASCSAVETGIVGATAAADSNDDSEGTDRYD
jgi:hypothetical protein